MNFLVLLEKVYQEKGFIEKDPAIVQEEAVEKPSNNMFDEEREKQAAEKFAKLSETDPTLYFFMVMLNLFILFAIFLGFLIDIYFLMRWVKRKPVKLKLSYNAQPRWGVPDVIKVTLIFMFFGYIFVILQGFFTDVFPIIYNDNFRMVFDTAFINIAGISVIVYFVVKKYGQNISTVGLTLKKFNKGVLYAIIAYIGIIPILIMIMTGIFYIVKTFGYKPPVQPIVQVFIEEKKTSVLWFSATFAAVFGPIAEEIFFRGFMYSALKKKMGIFLSMIITSAIFAFLHAHLVGFLPIMVLGILLAYLYEKTGSLVSSMVLHMLHNLGMLAMVFMVRAMG